MATWTRNYSNFLASYFAGPEVSATGGTAEYTSSNLTVRNASGDYIKIANTLLYPSSVYFYNVPSIVVSKLQNYAEVKTNYSISADKIGIVLGKGTYAGDEYEAFALADIITSGLGMATNRPSQTVTYDDVNHKYTKTFSFGITNTSNENISISELGLIASPYGTQSNSTGALIYYDTFETITLEPYESVVITISQSFPLINYEPYPTP